jgi:multimeric flavodoxin WrbA
MNPERIELLGICASPRRGNSSFLLGKALAAAKKLPLAKQVSTRLLELGAKKIAPCMSCHKCAGTRGECIVQDDFQSIRDQWVRADVILYSVPVYHLGIPGQLKCFLDRLGNSLRKVYPGIPSPRRLKVVGAIAQGAHLFSGQEAAVSFLLQHAVLMRCVPVSGDGWESYLGASGWTRADKSPQAIKEAHSQDEMDARVAVRACETLTQRCVETALIIKTGGRALRGILEADPVYDPFLKNLDRSLPRK